MWWFMKPSKIGRGFELIDEFGVNSIQMDVYEM